MRLLVNGVFNGVFNAVSNAVLYVVQFIVYVFVKAPVQALYLRGPFMGGYGFWEGQPSHEICARVTGVPSEHWVVSPDDCAAVIGRKLDAIYVLLYFWLYIIFLFVTARIILSLFRKRLRS